MFGGIKALAYQKLMLLKVNGSEKQKYQRLKLRLKLLEVKNSKVWRYRRLKLPKAKAIKV